MSKNSRTSESVDRKKKYLSMALSIIIAIGLWLFVINNENPTSTRTIDNVEVELLNLEVLEDNGLTIADMTIPNVKVVLEGKRSNLKSITRDDIVASIDVSKYSEGDNYVDVDVHAPSTVSVAGVNPSQVKLSIESIVTEDRDVEAVFEGKVADDYEAVCVELSTEIVSVSGAKSAVKRVAALDAKVDSSKLTEKEQIFNLSLMPVDAEGREVKNIDISVSEVSVTAQLYVVKTVKLTVPTIGQLSDSLELSGISTPSTVKIAGEASEVKGITEISANPIDLSEITSSTEIEIVPDVSGSVRFAASQSNVKAVVTVKKKSHSTFSYSVDDIDVTGLSDDYDISFEEDTVTLSVTGTESSMTSVASSDFTLSLDASGLDEGTHTVTLDVKQSNAAKDADITVTAPEVTVVITGK